MLGSLGLSGLDRSAFCTTFVIFLLSIPGVEVVMSKVASLPVCRSKSLGNSATTVKLSVEL